MLSVRCATHLWEIVPKGYDMPNKGDVVGYVDRIRCRYPAKWSVQMAGCVAWSLFGG